MRMFSRLLVLLSLCVGVAQAKPVVEQGDTVAIVGDSITEQKQYSRFIETYLLACNPELKLRVMQFGWGGERASGFVRRMENDMGPLKPDVVTTCYGMNDGGYRAYTDGIGKAYEEPMRGIVEALKAQGATVVVGSPGVVDTRYFRQGPEKAIVYNQSLAKLGELAKQVADDNGMPFADVNGTMMKAMLAGKAELGDDYDVGGRDGVHPQANGHLAMAYAFLKGMGFDGNLGSITIDAKGTATAAGGHKVLSSEAGKAEIESSRYIFCFYGGEKASGGTQSMLEFLPFNEDLNRLMLKVTNLEKEEATVTWGAQKKTYTKAQLEAGINLAAEFMENPFVAQFRQYDRVIAQKQGYETQMIKTFINRFPWMEKQLAANTDVPAAIETLRSAMWTEQERLATEAREALKPVTHTITVE